MNSNPFYQRRSGQEIDFVLDGQLAVEVKETLTPNDLRVLQARSRSISLNQHWLVGQKMPSNSTFDNGYWGENLLPIEKVELNPLVYYGKYP